MSVVTRLMGKPGPSGFGAASTAEEVATNLDLSGQVAVITGVASGLGFESARVLAARGAQVLGLARSLEQAQQACSQLEGLGGLRSTAQGGNTKATATGLGCDLSEPQSVRACVQAIRNLGTKLDIIIANAGVMALPERVLKHGQELQFLTNHVGHFLLVTGLLDCLAPAGRVVILSSSAHRWAPASGIQLEDLTLSENYTPRAAYGQSKLANLLFARCLARRLSGTGRSCNAVHPGVIATNLTRHLPALAQRLMPLASAVALKSIPQGAATQVYVAAHPGAAGYSGEYFADCNLARSNRHGSDLELGERLWDATERLVAAMG